MKEPRKLSRICGHRFTAAKSLPTDAAEVNGREGKPDDFHRDQLVDQVQSLRCDSALLTSRHVSRITPVVQIRFDRLPAGFKDNSDRFAGGTGGISDYEETPSAPYQATSGPHNMVVHVVQSTTFELSGWDGERRGR